MIASWNDAVSSPPPVGYWVMAVDHKRCMSIAKRYVTSKGATQWRSCCQALKGVTHWQDRPVMPEAPANEPSIFDINFDTLEEQIRGSVHGSI